jgi:hypothetical protein
MKKRIAAGAAGVLTALLLVGAPAASAATEFGSHCTANRAEEGESYAVVQLSQGGAQTAAPVSGVVTSWKISLVPVPFALPQQLKIFRPTGNPSQFQVVGESATANVVSGENTFATRIPIHAGDRIGLFANSQFGALFCSESPETEAPGNSIGIVLGNPTVGSTATLASAEAEALVPVAAVIEPDADNDGFGDETQDKCPQNAAFQTPCPAPVALSTSSAVKRGLVTVLVTSSAQAPVTVTGVAKLGKGKTANLSGGTQIVAPGTIAKFTLLFPKALKAKLKQISPKRSLTLNLTVAAPNPIGPASVSSLVAKLKGQAKPKHKHKHKHKAKAKAQA